MYRSNGYVRGANLTTKIANESLSVMYGCSAVKSDNYTAARSFKAAGTAATGGGWREESRDMMRAMCKTVFSGRIYGLK